MNTTMDYVYWDDPNELVECLRLFIAEQSAGGGASSGGGSRGPPGVGYKLTADGKYDADNKQLCNVAPPKQLNDAVNLNALQIELRSVHEVTTRLRSDLDILEEIVEKHRYDMDKKLRELFTDVRAIKERVYEPWSTK